MARTIPISPAVILEDGIFYTSNGLLKHKHACCSNCGAFNQLGSQFASDRLCHRCGEPFVFIHERHRPSLCASLKSSIIKEYLNRWAGYNKSITHINGKTDIKIYTGKGKLIDTLTIE
jgi:hypothetical protein